jgi:hypothetical protein
MGPLGCHTRCGVIRCDMSLAYLSIGRTHWAIAEGWIPSTSHGPEPGMTSRDRLSLNVSDQEANVDITIYYSDRDPVGRTK